MNEYLQAPLDEQLIARKVTNLAQDLCEKCPPEGQAVGKLLIRPQIIHNSRLPEPVKKFLFTEYYSKPHQSMYLYSEKPDGSIVDVVQLAVFNKDGNFVSSVMVTAIGGTRKEVDIHIGHGAVSSDAATLLQSWVDSMQNVPNGHLMAAEQILHFAEQQVP